ncbi:MAG: methylenetetrahydrofolate reductase (NADPH) [Lysobacterales bacterium]
MAEENPNLSSPGMEPYPERLTPGSSPVSQKEAAAELLYDGSIEFSYGSEEEISAAKEVLPFGMPVMIPHLPGHALRSRLKLIKKLHDAGFDPVPHISARKVESEHELSEFLAAAIGESKVHRVVLVGGDINKPSGPFSDSQSILSTGLLSQAGIKEVSFAGYPEGHPKINAELMFEALLDKLSTASEQGLGANVITQFSVLPSRIVYFCSTLAAAAPDVPVYAGIAAPGTARQLLHFARHCGVADALANVGSVGVKIAQLANHFETGKQLRLLASFNASHPSSNLIGVHIFSFGGFGNAANWMASRSASLS